MGVQNEGEQPGYGLRARSRAYRDGDQVEASVDVLGGGVGEVEVVRRHRRDVVEQLGGPWCVGQCPRDLGVDDRSAVALVEFDEPRAMKDPVASTSIRKPADVKSSVSSAAFSSRVWNGLIGVSRPGEKVIRLGVDINSTPPGRSTRKHSATNCP